MREFQRIQRESQASEARQNSGAKPVREQRQRWTTPEPPQIPVLSDSPQLWMAFEFKTCAQI